MDVSVNRDGMLVVVDEEGVRHVIDSTAIVSWSTLLGYRNAVDTVDAIVHVARNGEPAPCPESGDNCWTDDYFALEHVETARELEAFTAAEEGRAADPRSPALRGAIAARRASLDPVGAGRDRDSLLARCQQATRVALGVLDPESPPSAVRRSDLTCEVEPRTLDCEYRRREFTAADREKVRDILIPAIPALAAQLPRFCHSLTPHDLDPLAAPEFSPMSRATRESARMDTIAARYANPDDADGIPPASKET